MSEENKPCPFCGGKNNKIDKLEKSIGVYLYWVECRNTTCASSGPTGYTPEEAWEKWNDRKEE